MTPSGAFTLERLLAPVPPFAFLQEYWDQRPLILQRSDPDYYGPLLTAADVDRLVTTSDMTYPEFALVRDGAPLRQSDYTKTTTYGGTPRRVADPERIIAEYQQGATLILQALHRRWTPLATVCRSLEATLSHPAQTNIYVTPPGSQGFAPHYDTHDVFVLQVDGSKHWRVYDSAFAHPVSAQPYKDHAGDTPPLLYELDLQAGDLLYLPRGFVHEALTSEQRSIHITLGVTGYTWLDLLGQAVTARQEDARYRRNLPPGFAASEDLRTAMAAELAELAAELAQPEHARRAVDRMLDHFLDTRPPITPDRLFVAERLSELELNTLVQRRPEILFRLRTEGERVKLSFEGKLIDLPGCTAACVTFCTRDEPFCTADLPRNLNAAGRLLLVRRLLREGFLGYA